MRAAAVSMITAIDEATGTAGGSSERETTMAVRAFNNRREERTIEFVTENGVGKLIVRDPARRNRNGGNRVVTNLAFRIADKAALARELNGSESTSSDRRADLLERPSSTSGARSF